MLLAGVSIAAFLVAAVAIGWPLLPSFSKSAGLTPSERAAWVTRLFALADTAEEPAVSSAARALIAALVAGPDLKRGR